MSNVVILAKRRAWMNLKKRLCDTMPANQKLIDNIDCLIRLEQSGAAYPRIPNTAVLFLDQARDRLSEAADILRQAQSCILGEMPEDCSAVEGKLDTLDRIRGFLND